MNILPQVIGQDELSRDVSCVHGDIANDEVQGKHGRQPSDAEQRDADRVQSSESAAARIGCVQRIDRAT